MKKTISEKLLKRAELIRINALSFADGLLAGNFKSMQRGSGIEFSGVREYLSGDDAGDIDWNVTARLNKPFVQTFEEERDLTLFLLVDCSNSMQNDFVEKSKLEVALEIALLFCFAAEKKVLNVGLATFSGELDFFADAKSGKNHILHLIKNIDAIYENKNFSSGSALKNACDSCAKSLKNRALVIVVSDFRISGYEKTLETLAAKHDVLAVRICEDIDSKLPELGTARFVDSESGETTLLPTSSRKLQQVWQSDEKNRSLRFFKLHEKRGVFPLEISTNENPAAVLSNFFTLKGRQ